MRGRSRGTPRALYAAAFRFQGTFLGDLGSWTTSTISLSAAPIAVQDFLFSQNEQAFYAERGFTNEPKRCKNCRDKRKTGAATETAAAPRASDGQRDLRQLRCRDRSAVHSGQRQAGLLPRCYNQRRSQPVPELGLILQ